MVLEADLNKEAELLAYTWKVVNRIEKFNIKNRFIIYKDHKFTFKITGHLEKSILLKTQMGKKIRKIVLQDIYASLRLPSRLGLLNMPTASLLCPGMTLNNLMVRFEWCWVFGKCGVPLHCHCSQIHPGPEW